MHILWLQLFYVLAIFAVGVIGGRAPGRKDVYLAFGHGHLGLTMGAVTGQLIADLAANRTPAIDLAPFRAERF